MAREVPQYISQLGLSSLPRVQGSNAQSQAQTGVSEQLQSAAQKIYQTDMEIEQIRASTELQTNLNRQYMEAPNDPASLQALQQGYKKGFISNIKNQELRIKFDAAFDQYAAPLLDKATANKMQIQRQEHEFALRTAIDTSIETGASYVDGIKHNVPEFVMNAERTLQGNAVAFNEMVNAHYADGEPVFTPAQRASFLEQRTGRIRAKYKEVVSKEVKMLMLAASTGRDIPQEKILLAADHAKNAGMNEEYEELKMFAETKEFTTGLSRMSTQDMEQAIEREGIKIDSGDFSASARYNAALKVYQKKQEILKESPYAWFEAHGVISDDGSSVLDGEPAAIAATMEKRRTDVEMVRGVEGNSFKMPLLKPNEIAVLENIINTAPPDKAGEVLSSLGQILTAQERKDTAAWVDKKNPEIAVLMSVPPRIAAEAISGSRAKGYISDDAMRTAVSTALHGVSVSPEKSEQLRKAIGDVYRARAAIKGDTGNIVKPEILDGVIEDVLGKIDLVAPAAVESRLIIPHDMSAIDVEDRLASINDDVLKNMNKSLPLTDDGYRATAADILNKGEFFTIADGVVGVRFGSDVLYHERGHEYKIDIRKIPLAVRKSRLDGVLTRSRIGYVPSN